MGWEPKPVEAPERGRGCSRRRSSSGDGRGPQNRSGRASRSGGFDSVRLRQPPHGDGARVQDDPRRRTPRTDAVLADERLADPRDRLGQALLKRTVVEVLERCRAGTTKTNRIRQVSVGTAKKSTAPVERRWFSRNVRHVCEGGVRRSRHQPRDCPLRNCEPQLQQFPMDPRRAPERVLGGHIPDEAPHVSGDLRAASVRTRPPGPVPGEAAAVPADDRRGSDDHQGRLPVRPCPSQSEPEQPIGPTHGGLRASALVHS